MFVAIPYFYIYGRDLCLAGYRWTDLPRVYSLNLLLLPVVLAGVFASLKQIITGKKTAFRRTPKIENHTRTPLSYIFLQWLIFSYLLIFTVIDIVTEQYTHALFCGFNLIFLTYGLTVLVPMPDSLSDLNYYLRGFTKKARIAIPLLIILIFLLIMGTTQCTNKITPNTNESLGYMVGIWNNAEFEKPVKEWSDAAIKYGNKNSVIDLVIAQAQTDGFVSLKFPFKSKGVLYSDAPTDLVEKYLDQFESEGIKVILSIQPLNADINELIGIVLSRYNHHKNIIGINVDMEWKKSGTPYHVSNEERDSWLKEIKKYNKNYKLFLTYFKDYTYFPDDHPDIVVLYDGEMDTQTNLLRQYQELAKHYKNTGIYTGYLSSTPPVASLERIIHAVPNTRYILHTYDVFNERKLVIFEMDDVQVDWLESISIDLIDLHIEKKVPVICSVIPENLNNPDVGDGYLPFYLKKVSDHYSDLVEIGQHGYTHSESERFRGMSYEAQKKIIEKGLQIMISVGIKPSTFVPPYGSLDSNTVKVSKDLGFQKIINLYSESSSDETIILSVSNISLISGEGNDLAVKTPAQIMEEIDQVESSDIIILYHIYDFQKDRKIKLMELANVLDVLKNSQKYVFITARERKEYFVNQGIRK